jgi:Tol biopolymer transport system component
LRESGQVLLHYRLIEKIGEGGMGTVWRAQDTTLDRDAAVKILPDELANDSQQLARFEREAKLLASLNHPNLAAVFGVHAAESTRFLAMELVPGEDLAHRLQRGPLPVEELVPILARIADALEAAHAKGVVHRDLKPANVRLTPDGRVKVLDFGLAKAVEGDPSSGSGSADFPLTATGVVLGTAPYMSPEQARGRPVDARTDVWSFGCVAWECLTGERPFRGETVPDLIAAILNDEPDWSSLPAGTPPSLLRLLRRCLAKKPRDRLHHVADARIELEEAVAPPRAETDAPMAAVRETETPARGRLALLVAAAVLLGALGALLLRGTGAPAPRKGLLAGARFKRLTAYPGDELDAAISPDGRFVAFFADVSGTFHPYLGRTGEGEYVNMAEGKRLPGVFRVVPDRLFGTAVRRIGFMGDGEGLWFSGDLRQKLSVMSLMGDHVRPWLAEHTIHVDWSPRGDRILYSLGSGGDPVYLADPDGANVKELPLPTEAGYHQHFPTWSPDGRWIYVVRGRVMLGDMALWRVRADGSGLERLTEDVRDVGYPVPIHEKTVLFIARELDGSGPWLWEFDLDTRRSRRATVGVEKYTSLSASRDRRQLVATVANPRAELWTVPIRPGEPATETDAKAYPLAAVRAYGPRLRGQRLFFLSSMGEGDGLWCQHDGQVYEVWKSGRSARLEHPCAVSPDGRRVAIVVQEQSCGRLLVMNADGTEPRAMMEHVDVGGAACWSPDGAWVAAGGTTDGRRGLFRVRVRDGHAEQIHGTAAWNPVWSPDGSRVVFAGAQIGPEQFLQAIALDGGSFDFPMIRVPARGERVRFLPDGSGVVYIAGAHPRFDFHLFDFASGRTRRLTQFADPAIMRTFDITPDGKTIVFDRRRDNSDIVLIERDVAE